MKEQSMQDQDCQTNPARYASLIIIVVTLIFVTGVALILRGMR